MPLVEAAPLEAVQPARGTVLGALFQPRALFGALTPGSIRPAVQLVIVNFALVSIAAVLTDDALWLGDLLPALGRGLSLWLLGATWLLGPQAQLFKLVMRMFGANRPLSLAQRGMAALSTLLAVFGVLLSVAGINPESAPFVITWIGSVVAAAALGAHALFRLAEGAYGLPTGKAIAAVLVFAFVHALAFSIVLGVLFTVVGG